MMKLELKDSQLNGQDIEEVCSGDALSIIIAIDKLNDSFIKGNIQIISLFNYVQNDISESLVSYKVTSYSTAHNKKLPEKLRFYTSHYIGCCRIGDISIMLRPRYGAKIFNYMLKYAVNIYVAPNESGNDSVASNFYWLIALLWKSMLNKALSQGHIPKDYVRETKNLESFRGKLNLHQHIHANLTNQSKFYCTYNTLTANNTINKAIRLVYSILNSEHCGAIIKDFAHYDERLESMGVALHPIGVAEIDKIKYNKMNSVYRPVMNISRNIIQNKGLSAGKDKSSTPAYFIDVAELWEYYLLKVLQRNLPDYRVYSPNSYYGDFLLENCMRQIRPDIIIEKDGKIVMIIDAKYKGYTQIGRTSSSGVHRDDLYQMTTYLYHYGQGLPLVGILSSPEVQGDNVILHNFANNKLHRIGVVNIPLSRAENSENVEVSMREIEKEYINKIKMILDSQTIN